MITSIEKRLNLVVTMVLLACSTLLTTNVSAVEYYVAVGGSDANSGTSWTAPFGSITNALAQADVTVVTVSNGTYTITDEIVVDKAVTIISYGSGVYGGLVNASNTVVGQDDNRVFNATAAGVVIDGLNLSGIVLPHNSVLNGFVVYMNNGVLKNCIVEDNEGSQNWQVSPAVVGAVYMDGGTVTNCIIRRNATGQRSGSTGIRAIGAMIVDSEISSNTNTYLSPNKDGTVSAAGIYATGSSQILRCKIIDNICGATSGSGGGGGVWADGTTVLRNCLIAGNSQTDDGQGKGGGVYGGIIDNCTIVSNSCPNVVGLGGGVYNSVVTNSIVWGNTTGSGTETNYGGTASFSYSLTAPLPAGTNNIAADPMFVDMAAGDYRLTADSPCIDVALYQDWMATTTDVDGDARKSGTAVDMGCYEYQYPSGTILILR